MRMKMPSVIFLALLCLAGIATILVGGMLSPRLAIPSRDLVGVDQWATFKARAPWSVITLAGLALCATSFAALCAKAVLGVSKLTRAKLFD